MIALLLTALLTQAATPDASHLAADGWQLVPSYAGAHRSFLTEDDHKHTAASAHLFAAAIELDENYFSAFQGLGHAQVLLAEDLRNRGQDGQAREHFEQANSALHRAIELYDADPWAHYALGPLLTGFGEHDLALDSLANAVEKAEARLASGGDQGRDAWLRFKALEWTPEVHMRAGQFEEARTSMHAFHTEFSNNEWPLLIALGESYSRERNFAAARESYEKILATFPDDHQAYALLGYLEGLTGNSGAAVTRIEEAIERELQPGFYTRLWLWILAKAGAREKAKQELTQFVAHPPSSIATWDLALGRFLLGAGSEADFIAQAYTEVERRMQLGLALDGLLCEAWFYAGLRSKRAAEAEQNGKERIKLERLALGAYRESLAFVPVQWKWEWAFARQHFAELAEGLSLEPVVPFALEAAQLTSLGETVATERSSWHAPNKLLVESDLGRAPRPGDLFLARVQDASGRHAYRVYVVGAR